MAAVFRIIAAVSVVAVALSGAGVSAQTHHVVGEEGGWGPALNVTSWLSGRVFRVGDKIWFKYSGTGESIVELEGLKDFLSCNLTNPYRRHTDGVSHVVLGKEGVRYFTSGNFESCKNGLKLPVPVQPSLALAPPLPILSPPFKPTPAFRPPPPPPSVATHLTGLSFLIFAGLLISYTGMYV